MRILEEIGILFLNKEALQILKDAGCDVDMDTQRVRMDRAFVMEQVKKAPKSFTITPRNPERKVTVGGDAMLFVNVSSPPNAMDLDRGRRPGDRESFRDLMKLTQYFNCIHLAGGYPVEPVDIHASIRHLDCDLRQADADRQGRARLLARQRAGGRRDGDGADRRRPDARGVRRRAAHVHQHQLLLAAEARSSDARRRDAARPPRPADDRDAVHAVRRDGAGDDRRRGRAADGGGALRHRAAAGDPARALPVVYGSFTSNVDMKSGAPAFGTPEYVRATQISGQMARYYGLPLRASNACAANAPDAQAAWESANSLWACITAKANVVYHAAGWLEGGLIASYEKFVIDCETLQQVMHYMKPIGTTDDDIAVDAIARSDRAATSSAPSTRRRATRRRSTARSSPTGGTTKRGSWPARCRRRSAPTRSGSRFWRSSSRRRSTRRSRRSCSEFVERRKREGGAPTDF